MTAISIVNPYGPLDGAFAKLRRVEKQIDELQALLAASINNSHRLRRKIQTETGKLVFVVEDLNLFLSPDCSVLIGEIVHNLRSSLDHLMYRLAERNSFSRLDHVYFPIETTEKSFLNKTECVPINIRTILKGFQPYIRPQEMDFPLLLLKDFSNIDKHRRIHIVERDIVAYQFNWRINGEMYGRIVDSILEEGAILAPFSAEESARIGQSDVYINFSIRIIFGEGSEHATGMSTQETITGIFRYVEEV